MKDKAREYRIDMEIVVDAYNEEERAMGWYYYLQDNLRFPFQATCIARRNISPLTVGEEIMVEDMAPEEECQREMFVETRWQRRKLAVPLAQLQAIQTDSKTHEAIRDWHY